MQEFEAVDLNRGSRWRGSIICHVRNFAMDIFNANIQLYSSFEAENVSVNSKNYRMDFLVWVNVKLYTLIAVEK